MCGIVGVLAFKSEADPAFVERMSRVLRHRGPDAHGVYTKGSVGLGFRRLSILDLTSAGDQPMLSADGRFALVFNGEIFNYVELRSELQTLGHRFTSTGDTEVLLHAYQQWGRDCLPRLNGMWAFLIHDARTGTIFGSRDRFGIKPLYRCRTPDGVLFASEIKAIRASGAYTDAPNWATVSRFLRSRLDFLESTGETFYAGIEQVPAGSAFELSENGDCHEWRYWSLEELPDRPVLDPQSEFRDLFEDAIRLRMRSDVPVGVSLSGGLDSTSIISIIARQREAAQAPRESSLQAFSFMSADYDESPYIAETLQQTGAELHRIEAGPRALWDNLDRFLWFHDEPVHSFAAMIGFEIYGLAAANGVKVVLSGQGADEVLAGYPSYFDDYWDSLLRSGKLSQLQREIASYARVHGRAKADLVRRTLKRYFVSHLRRSSTYRAAARRRKETALRSNPWFTPEVAAVHHDPAGGGSARSLEDTLRWSVERAPLPLYLRIEDRNSMAHSVEARVPFLDYRIVSMAFQIGSHWKLQGPWNKYLLRQAMTGRIPESVRTRADKMGFPVPGTKWFGTALYEPMQDLLASDATRTRGLYNIGAIRRDLQRHRDGEVDVTNQLFAVAQLERWLAQQGDSQSAVQPQG